MKRYSQDIEILNEDGIEQIKPIMEEDDEGDYILYSEAQAEIDELTTLLHDSADDTLAVIAKQQAEIDGLKLKISSAADYLTAIDVWFDKAPDELPAEVKTAQKEIRKCASDLKGE